MARVDHNNIGHAGGPAKRQAILEALTRATATKQPSGIHSRENDDGMGGYYTLTIDELTALVNGDIQTIRSWVSNLDRRHATWLLNGLIKERE